MLIEGAQKLEKKLKLSKLRKFRLFSETRYCSAFEVLIFFKFQNSTFVNSLIANLTIGEVSLQNVTRFKIPFENLTSCRNREADFDSIT